jgi:predicted  nucleic acid-binding Zn-ribbon protein
MTRIAVVVVVCGALLVGLVHGYGARVEVAKDKAMQRIDSLLGSMDVKRKEIELSVNGLKEGIDGLTRAKIKAQVCGDQVQRQAKPQEERLASMDSALKTIREHLEAGKPVEIAGKTYSPAELNELADRVIQARKVSAGQLDGLHEAQGRLQKVVVTLERKQQEIQNHLTEIEGQVAVIDSNRIALTAMQRSAEAMGESDGSLAKSLDHLQDKVNGLFADVEVELRCQVSRGALIPATDGRVDTSQ